MLQKIFIFFISLTAVSSQLTAQNPIAELSDLSKMADACSKRNQSDSALLFLLKAEVLIDKKKLQKEVLSSIIYNLTGDCWQQKNDISKAHTYFIKALNNAVKQDHSYEARLALGSLTNLHRYIKEKDLLFNYPLVKETELTGIMFPVVSTNTVNDSIDVTIHAGKYDGISDDAQSIDIYTHFIGGDTSSHTGLNFISSGRILQLSNNHCIIRTPKSTIPVLKNDIAFIKAHVPASWRSLSLYNMLMRNIYLVDNYRKFIYDYRYLYYYADSSVEKITFKSMHEAIKEAAMQYADDTLSNTQFSTKNKAGIFSGYNVIASMIYSKAEDIQLFLNFVNHYPMKYVGNNYKISETYGTWLINSTPLAPSDVKPYLLRFDEKQTVREEIKKLEKQIKEDNLTDQWLDDGMQQANLENVDEANRTAGLLKETLDIVGDQQNAGWVDYIKANVQRRLYNNKSADSLLNNAKKQFTKSGNAEGVKWIANTEQLWKKNNTINAGVQNGHLFSYQIAQSYNPRFFATGGSDNLIKIWDKNLGKEIVTLNDHEDEINALTYSSNGRYLASTGQDKRINIYNAYNYGLIYSIKTQKAERAIAFSKDNEYLASAGFDSLIKIRNFKKDSVVQTLRLHKGTINDICYHPLYSSVLFSAGSDSMVYKWDLDDGQMSRWYKLKGKVLSVKVSSDGQYMSTVSTDSVLSLWNLQTNKKVATYRISVFKQGTSRYFAQESFSPDGKYIALPYARDSMALIRLRDRSERDYGTNIPYVYLADLQFSKDGLSLFARFNNGGPLVVYNFANWDIEHNTTISWKEIKSYANVLMAVQFIANDNKLAILHSGASKIDLRNGKTEHVFLSGMTVEARTMFLNDEKRAISFNAGEPSFKIFEYATQKDIATYSLPIQETIAAFEMSPDNKYAFLGGHFGYVYGWNIETGEQLFGKEYSEMKRKKVTKIIYDKYRHQVFSLTDSSVFIIDAGNGKILKEINIPDINYAIASRSLLYACDNNGWLYKYDAGNYKAVDTIALNNKSNPVYQLLLSNDEKILFARNNYTDLTAIQTATGKILYNIKDHDYLGSMLAISKDDKLLASAGFDSNVKLYDPETGKHIANVYVPYERDAIIIDTAGYYLAPKNSLDALLFSYNNNAFSYEQFDVQFNRPDLVLKNIRRSDSTTLSNYLAAYKKRMTKLNMPLSSAQNILQIPMVRLQNKHAVQTVTTEKEYEFTVECKDNLYNLANLQVLVNNNPVLGINGLDLSKLSTKAITKKINVKLSTGPNTIKIFCTNTKGGRSLNEQLEIFAKYKSDAPHKTYFIGIAVADYKDSAMNLQYSVKDVRDLAKSFYNLYSDVEIDTLINKTVTRENILALRKKLENTTVNDRVILAITGHGLLSKSFDFYYATWDNDFTKPAARGIKYDDLENLLTDIPARKKLMLIDACHSGALDKEELLAQQTTIQQGDTSSQVTGTITRGVIKINKNASAGNSFEMMQKLFTDLKGNNGAVIISAAGGMEYALESSRWNNGVFTYCVRRGIEDKQADKEGGNFDGRVSVQELQQYVSKKVSELTAGKQQPNNRRENVDFEWWLRN